MTAPTADIKKARIDFPLLSRKVDGKFPIYLDSAATTLKPWPVIERLSQFYSFETANVHRGAHFLSDKATENYENAREKTRAFLNARSINEIIFTRGTTESINLAAQTLAAGWLKAGDEILLTELEHHSNIVPWQMAAEKTGARVRAIPVTTEGALDLEEARALIGPRTKVLAVTHCSNSLGTICPVEQLTEWVHAAGGLVLVDGAQRVAAAPVDVQKINADFYAFSGHKMFGPYGIGVLYGREALLEKLPPYQGGGSMIHEVTFEKTTYHDLPHKFEAGTPNIAGVLGLAAAIDYLGRFSWADLHQHEQTLVQSALTQLRDIPGVTVYGPRSHHGPIASFNLEGAHASDVGQLLSQQLVAIRAGHHCTQPLMKRLGVPATARASFSIYNNEADVTALIQGVLKAREMLR